MLEHAVQFGSRVRAFIPRCRKRSRWRKKSSRAYVRTHIQVVYIAF